MSNKTNDTINDMLWESTAPTFSIACRAFQIPYKIAEIIQKMRDQMESAEENT
jgi:hypothetical protein